MPDFRAQLESLRRVCSDDCRSQGLKPRPCSCGIVQHNATLDAILSSLPADGEAREAAERLLALDRIIANYETEAGVAHDVGFPGMERQWKEERETLIAVRAYLAQPAPVAPSPSLDDVCRRVESNFDNFSDSMKRTVRECVADVMAGKRDGQPGYILAILDAAGLVGVASLPAAQVVEAALVDQLEAIAIAEPLGATFDDSGLVGASRYNVMMWAVRWFRTALTGKEP